MESPYEVLGVDADADEQTVEQAYRRRAKEVHPDRGGSVEAFRRVREAYEQVVAGEATPPETVEDPPDGGNGHHDGDADRDEDVAGVRAPGVNTAPSGRGADEGPDQTRVEYLNFDVVDDHGRSLADDDLFEWAAGADLAHDDYGRFIADADEHLLQAAEAQGYTWPFACRGGACANCAVYLADGEVETTLDNVLSEEMVAAGFRLSCICKPAAERLRIVYNVKHLPGLEEFRLPASRFERARGD